MECSYSILVYVHSGCTWLLRFYTDIYLPNQVVVPVRRYARRIMPLRVTRCYVMCWFSLYLSLSSHTRALAFFSSSSSRLLPMGRVCVLFAVYFLWLFPSISVFLVASVDSHFLHASTLFHSSADYRVCSFLFLFLTWHSIGRVRFSYLELCALYCTVYTCNMPGNARYTDSTLSFSLRERLACYKFASKHPFCSFLFFFFYLFSASFHYHIVQLYYI